MLKRNLGTIIRVVLSVTLLALLFNQFGSSQILDHLIGVHPVWYLIGLLVYILSIALWSLRWYYVIRASGERYPFRRVFTTMLVGNFFSLFLPEMVGVDLARMYELTPTRGTNANIVSTVLLDRIAGLVALVLMALVALVFGSQFVNNSTIFLVVGGLLLGFVVGWTLFFNRRFMEWCFRLVFRLPLVNRLEKSVRKLYEALYALHNQPRLLAGVLILALVAQIVQVVSVVWLGRATNVPVSPIYFFVIVPIVWLLTTLPISISGLGVREGAFAFFFSQVGGSSDEAVALSLLYYSFSVVTGLVGGLIFLRVSVGSYLRKRHALEGVPQA